MMNTFTLDRARASAEEIAPYQHSATVAQFHAVTGSAHRRVPDLFYGHAVKYVTGVGETCFSFWPGDEFPDVLKALYVIDGIPYYVAGWERAPESDGRLVRAQDGYVILHPMGARGSSGPFRRAYVVTSTAILA